MKTSRKNLRDSFRCGDCMHFKVQAHLRKESVCSNLGVRASAVAPTCFTPDATQIVGNSDQMLQLANLFHNYTLKQRRIFLSFLQQSSERFKFGTKVYFLAVGRDYLSNYLSGYVLGLDSNKHIIVTGDPDNNKRGAGYTATFINADDLLDATAFEKKKQELFERGRFNDPKKPLQEISTKVDIDYEPPTLDKYNVMGDKPKPKARKSKAKKKTSNKIKIT